MDRSALQQVFAANRRRLLNFLRTRALDEGEAEDCLQEMWLRINAARPGKVRDPLSYLYRMADNMVIDLRRMAGRRGEREGAWASRAQGVLDDVDPAPTAEQMLLDRERLRAVQAAIDELPERSADIFRRFRLDGVSQKQLAQELGVTVSAIEKHLQKAYKAILAALDEGLMT